MKDANGMEQFFAGLDVEIKKKINETHLLIYICEGEENEIKEWFKTINIAGIPLNEQELLNAIYSGNFVTKAKEGFFKYTQAQNYCVVKFCQRYCQQAGLPPHRAGMGCRAQCSDG